MSTSSPHGVPSLDGSGGKTKRSRRHGHRRQFVDEDIDGADPPTLVFVEGPARFFKPYFLDELVSALNKRLNVIRCTHSAGSDGAVRTRQRFNTILGTENRRGSHEG